jgi:PAS domain S-box-containing protein
LAARRLPVSVLTAGTALNALQLTPSQSIGWNEFRTLLANAATIWNRHEMEALGQEFVLGLRRPAFGRAMGLALGPADLYVWITREGSPIGRMFSCLEYRAWEVSPGRLMFELAVRHGHAPCPELYAVWKGALEALPELLSAAPARVRLEAGGQSALFHIELPGSEGWLARGRRTLKRLRTLPTAVNELQAAHDLLNRQHQELRAAQETLRQSEERFRALIEHSSDFILLADADGRVIYVSPSAERVVGGSAQEIVGQSHAELAHADDRPEQALQMARLLEAPGRIVTLLFRFRRADQAWIWLEGTAKNMLEDKRVRALVINYRDVTARVRLEQELLQSRKLQSIGYLAGGIAHDFNNILTGMIVSAQLAMRLAGDSDPVRVRLEEIVDYSRRATQLTSQLLAFARKQIIKPKPINLNRLVLDTRTLLDRLLGDQVEIVTQLEADLATVEVDPNSFQQVIVNLAINARDAMPGGGTLSISTANVERLPSHERLHSQPAAATPERAVLLTVSDTGSSMDEATLSQLFEPFFTTKELGRGTGLGLATCHGIVSQAGGRIEASNNEGAGATFRIYLPGVAAKPVAVPLRGAKGDDTPRGNEVVLLVEDEAAILRFTSEWLRELGYTVLTAANGQIALERAAQHEGRIDIVVSDVVMPKLGGPELIRRLRQTRPEARWLFISGYVEADALPAGAALLSKPFEMAELAARLRQLLDNEE